MHRRDGIGLFRRHVRAIVLATLLILLLAKYYQSYVRFDIPLGYDVGIYRYLFLRYSEALPSLHLPALDPWAQEHPIGLFLFSTPLLMLGVPVGAMTGWMWNLAPVVFACAVAWVSERRFGKGTGVFVLLLALFSQPLYDGFVAMYWKTILSLLFTVFAYHHFEKRSLWFYPLAFLAVITHHQTGLIVALAAGTWWLLNIRSGRSDPFWRRMTVLCALLGLAAFAVYLPHFQRSFWSPFKSIFLLRGDSAPSGSFPDTMFYVRTMTVSLLLGGYGFWLRARKSISLWELSVLWCAVFIVFKLVFYKRFFLQLDVFLLPFAALAITDLCTRRSFPRSGWIVVALLAVQSIISFQGMLLRTPSFSLARLNNIVKLGDVLPKDSAIIALENESGPWLLGWLPQQRAGAPGLFDVPGWSYDQWERFLYGADADRKSLLSALRGETYFYLTPSFLQYYGDHVKAFLHDPCLVPVKGQPLLRSVCTPK